MTCKQKIALIALFIMGILTEAPTAQDLGVQGSLYEIKEQNALQWIGKKLQEMQSSGEISRQQSILKEKALLTLERPTPVKGLKPTERPRTFEKDLTVFVASDIRDAKDNLIHPAGTKMNPLSKMLCKKILLFLDGDSPQQLQWALNQYQQKPNLIKLVLVNGPVLALMRTLEIPLYFDQAGRLVNYFQIEQIPAMVSQVQDKLQIMEIKL